jgi:hypothetical protein
MPLANSNEHNARSHWWYVWIPIFGAFIWFGEWVWGARVEFVGMTSDASNRHHPIHAHNMVGPGWDQPAAIL